VLILQCVLQVILGGSTMEDILADVSQFIKKEKWWESIWYARP